MKEKLLAAHRAGMGTIIIPADNEKDLVEIPKNIVRKLDIRPVSVIDEVLEIALTEMPTPVLAATEAEKPLAGDHETNARTH